MKREIKLERQTKETQISLSLNLDGQGEGRISTGIGFFDHMLILFSSHGGFDLNLDALGDAVDNHHVIEDIGILLGKAFYQALGNKAGIKRYSSLTIPMDEALCRISIDISGRSYLVFDVPLSRDYIGDFETEMLEEFFVAFSSNARITLHITSLYGKNNHHIIEGIFKCFGRALKEACTIGGQKDIIPSTKGLIE